MLDPPHHQVLTPQTTKPLCLLWCKHLVVRMERMECARLIDEMVVYICSGVAHWTLHTILMYKSMYSDVMVVLYIIQFSLAKLSID